MHAVGDSLWADCAVMGRGQHRSQVSPRATDNGMIDMTSVAPAWSPLQQNPPVSAASALPGIEIPRHIWLYSYLTLFVFTIVQRPVAGLPERCQEPWPEVFSGVGCCVGGRVLLRSCHLHVAGGDGVGVEVGGGLVDGRLLGSVSRLLSPWTPSHGPSRWTGSMAAGVGCGSFTQLSSPFIRPSAVHWHKILTHAMLGFTNVTPIISWQQHAAHNVNTPTLLGAILENDTVRVHTVSRRPIHSGFPPWCQILRRKS